MKTIIFFLTTILAILFVQTATAQTENLGAIKYTTPVGWTRTAKDGSVAINGRVLTINSSNPSRYVIRGWLELPDMTILEVCGPWYNDDVIPQEIFNNPAQGANLNKKWVRKK